MSISNDLEFAMTPELAFASIRHGDLSADEAWKMLSPLVEIADQKTAKRICDALRSWTWKALDRRRRDAGLREWLDLINRIESIFVEKFSDIAAKIETLSEMLHESISISDHELNNNITKKKHIMPIINTLYNSNSGWTHRSLIMNVVNIKQANTTRLMSMLVDVGLVEQKIEGREILYRISAEGVAQVHRSMQNLDEQIENTMDLNEEIKVVSYMKSPFVDSHIYEKVLNATSEQTIDIKEKEWESVGMNSIRSIGLKGDDLSDGIIKYKITSKLLPVGA